LCHLYRLFNSNKQTTRVGLTGTGQVQGSAVVNRGTDDGQAQG